LAGGKKMPKYTDDEIRNMKKITCKIAGEYLGISSMAVSMGMRNNLLPIGFAIHNEEKADWYDPTIAREDEYLGKRDHGKNKDEKDLDKNQVQRNWYW
jgi:hypothetical protein